MLQYLNDDELNDLSLHSDEQALKPVREALSAQHQANGERDDEFWEKQRSAIWRKIGSQQASPARRQLPSLVWAAALLLLALSPWAFRHPAAVTVQKTAAPQVTVSDSDLLAQVEDEVDSDSPAALQPAAMLADEMNQSTKNSSVNTQVQMKEQN